MFDEGCVPPALAAWVPLQRFFLHAVWGWAWARGSDTPPIKNHCSEVLGLTKNVSAPLPRAAL